MTMQIEVDAKEFQRLLDSKVGVLVRDGDDVSILYGSFRIIYRPSNEDVRDGNKVEVN